jgi:hypothetical protein
MFSAIEAIAAFAGMSIADQVEKKILPKLMISKGLCVSKNFKEDVEFTNVKAEDGRLIKSVTIPVVINFFIKEGTAGSRGGYEPKDCTVRIRPMTKYVENDGHHSYIDRESIQFSAYCSTIIHEVTHLVDDKISSYRDLFLLDKSTDEMKIKNWNMSGEFRAFLNQLIYQIRTRATPKLQGAVTKSNIKGHPAVLQSLNLEPSDFLKSCEENKLYDPKLNKRIDILDEANKAMMLSAIKSLQEELSSKFIPASGYTGASA